MAKRRRGAPEGSQNALKLYPEKTITVLDAIKHLSRIGCPMVEIASFLELSEETLKRHFDEDPAYREAWELGRMQGRISLRHLQWWHAQRDNASGVAMTIHMSKQKGWLDEHEGAVFAREGEDKGRTALGGAAAILAGLPDTDLDVLIRVRQSAGRSALAGSPASRKGPQGD